MYCKITYIMRLGFDFPEIIGYEWDKGNLEHIKKHNVLYTECEEVFLNKPLVVLFDEGHSGYEKRYKIFGITAGGRTISLAVTVRKNKIRVITARDQSKKERMAYEEVTSYEKT